MTSTRWIAVALMLFSMPVFAQESASPKFASPANHSDETAEQEVGSFEAELDRLRHEIAATKSLRENVVSETSETSETSEAPEADTTNRQAQRQELFDLLAKLASRKPVVEPQPTKPSVADDRPNPPTREPRAQPAAAHPLITDKIVDPFALGRTLFRAEDFRGAELAFRKVKVTDDNRVLLQYLIATCLRKQSQWDQAARAYRVVAENKVDPALRDLAIWQLENIRWHQQTDAQLKQLREWRSSPDAPAGDSPAAKRAESPGRAITR